jgi:cyclopropane fatty-acyl-phospholipid synthase-like methyltransferase
MTHEAIQAIFDDWAGSGRADMMEPRHQSVAEQVIAQMDMRPGMQVLDMGCGTGWATRLLGKSAPGATAVGIDCSPAMVKRAEELHDLTSRARYMVSQMEQVAFKDGRFDRIFSMEALSYAPDMNGVLQEAFRLTKVGGSSHFIIGRYKECVPSEGWSDAMGLAMAWLSEEEWRGAMQEAGFSDVQVGRVRAAEGPGEESEFTPYSTCPDWESHLTTYESGYLWLKGQRS